MADKIEKFLELADMMRNKTAIDALITMVVKGGLLADVSGLRGFIPKAFLEADVEKNIDLSSYVGKKLTLIPVEVDVSKMRLVLSHRAFLEREKMIERHNRHIRNESEVHKLAENIAENSEIKEYQTGSKPLCIKANDKAPNNRPNILEHNKKDLVRKYPAFGMEEFVPADFFDTIIKKEFIDGITKGVFIRNYTFDDSNNIRLAIRPKRTPGDYLSQMMPENKTLLFKGFVTGDYFIVDGVSDQYNENLLPYEVPCQIIRYDDSSRVKQARGNFLYVLAEEASSLNEHTKQRLVEWKEYIEWRRTIVKKRMRGAHYINVENKDGNLQFTLLFDSKEDYDKEAKWLKRNELAAYAEKEYSDDNGRFIYIEEKHRGRENFEPLGNLVRRLKKDGRIVNGHYEVELVYAVPDNDEMEEMTDEERDEYVQNELLPRYPKVGFLAPLVIKDLSLFKRLDKAVTDLQQDRDCHSPNMAMWIFDVRRARLPQPQDRVYWENMVGNNWLNKDVADNPNQREAIFKMLAAPDLCLIQGPPGTGKTTVIAEAIYQFARQGNRVLLASQSHDAVDNALDRLADRSEIRAIRLGERDRDGGEERSKFSQFRVLSTYYSCLGKSVSHNFLTPWEENRQSYGICEIELRDWRYVTEDLNRMNRELTDLNINLEQCRRNLFVVENNLQKASEENSEHENSKRQYLNFVGQAERNEINVGDFYLPTAMGDIIAPIFMDFLNKTTVQGLILNAAVSEEVIRRDPKLSVASVATAAKKLFAFHDKLASTIVNASADAGVAKLKCQQIDEKIAHIQSLLADEDDKDKRRELKAKREQLRDEKKKIKGETDFLPSSEELSFFNDETKAKLNSAEGRADLEHIIADAKELYQSALDKVITNMGEVIDAYQPQDVDALSEQVKSCKGQLKQLNEEMRLKREEITAKEKLGEELSAKYNCDRSEIEARIENTMKNLDEEWNRDAQLRDVWHVSLEQFVERLNDDKTAKYDEDYYKDIYMASCNVVGITCTANMRELDEKFPDFDVVIIDEVSKATPPELLPPLMKARKTVLVGDHRQLPPVFNEYEKSYNELLEEINAADEDDDDEEEENREIVLHQGDLEKYRKMVTSSLFREYFEQADDSIKHSLLTQYRMHSNIQNVINRFYDGKLTSGVLDEEQRKAHNLSVRTDNGDSFLSTDTHAYWIDSSKLNGRLMEQSRYPGSTSLHNIFEKYIILSVLQKINDAYATMKQSGITVGVISFYGSQVGDLRKAVKEMRNQGKLKALKVDVNTVDRFQGKEKQIIITSLVCNTKHGNASRHVAAFERINVAFSRAQNLLIIVGAKDLYNRLTVPIPSMDTGEIRSAHTYQGIISDIERNGGFVVGETLVPADIVQKIRDEYDREAKER